MIDAIVPCYDKYLEDWGEAFGEVESAKNYYWKFGEIGPVRFAAQIDKLTKSQFYMKAAQWNRLRNTKTADAASKMFDLELELLI